MDIETVIERLNAIGEWSMEYETTHKDSGDSYSHMVAESWCSDQERALIDYMKEKNIDWTDVDIDAIADSVLDQFTMESGHLWSAGNGDCLLIAFPVGEVEMQIDAQEIGLGCVTEEICETLSRQSDFFCRMQDSETILACQGTDSVWDACISETALRGIVAALRDSL